MQIILPSGPGSDPTWWAFSHGSNLRVREQKQLLRRVGLLRRSHHSGSSKREASSRPFALFHQNGATLFGFVSSGRPGLEEFRMGFWSPCLQGRVRLEAQPMDSFRWGLWKRKRKKKKKKKRKSRRRREEEEKKKRGREEEEEEEEEDLWLLNSLWMKGGAIIWA